MLIKLSSVLDRTVQSKSAVYDRVKQETFPPPIKLGARASAWVQSEVDAWIKAKIVGATDDELKELVRSLVADRKTFLLH